MQIVEIESKIKTTLSLFYERYKNELWISFALINLAFLFHTINFMSGDHDWNYIKAPNYWSEGSFEGRPLHFVLQAILFDGHILPILNNVISFFALALSGILLAKYWQIPYSKTNYVLFSVFTATLPYTMVWLFYAKDMLINLSLPLIGVSSLLLAEKAIIRKNIYYHLIAVLMMFFAFASYVAMINFYGVCFLSYILISYINKKDNIFNIIKQNLPVMGDMFIGIILFKISLMLSNVESSYNTKIISLDYLPKKIMETIYAMFEQFVIVLPFMEFKYKLLLLIMCLLAVFLIFAKAKIKKVPVCILLLLGILFSSKLAYFIADERGQILAEMENFAFVPRLDFYGLVYVYALSLACIIQYSKKTIYKVGVGLICIITFMSFVRDMYAQKVWKLGFDAEMKAHERIVSRIEEHPLFYPNRQYRLLQIGSLSLRENYYKKDIREIVSLDLLSTSFTPEFMSRIVYNFYYPKNIFYNNASVEELSPYGQQFLFTEAKTFPQDTSIFIDNDIIIVVLTDDGLYKAKSKLARN